MKFRSALLTAAVVLTGWTAAPAQAETRVEISLKSRYLTLLNDGQVIGKYPVAIGAPESPTVAGNFAVTKMDAAPFFHKNGQGDWARPEQPGWHALYGLCADRRR